MIFPIFGTKEFIPKFHDAGIRVCYGIGMADSGGGNQYENTFNVANATEQNIRTLAKEAPKALMDYFDFDCIDFNLGGSDTSVNTVENWATFFDEMYDVFKPFQRAFGYGKDISITTDPCLWGTAEIQNMTGGTLSSSSSDNKQTLRKTNHGYSASTCASIDAYTNDRCPDNALPGTNFGEAIKDGFLTKFSRVFVRGANGPGLNYNRF